jgi:flagellar biosynthesis protein FliQ
MTSAALFQEGLLLLGTVGGPIFAALLVGGFVIGVLQAATQINDPAVGFVPRLAASVGVAWYMGPWIAERLAAFLVTALERMSARPF